MAYGVWLESLAFAASVSVNAEKIEATMFILLIGVKDRSHRSINLIRLRESERPRGLCLLVKLQRLIFGCSPKIRHRFLGIPGTRFGFMHRKAVY
jgi:hypothetical protein